MAYIFANPNPKGARVGDCVIRALSLALKKPWKEIYTELAVYGYSMSDMPSANAVWDAMLRDHGLIRKGIPDKCGSGCYTVKDFCRDNPQGLFVLGTGNHVVTVINGDYMDTWDSGEEIPMYYYEGGI